MRCVTCQSAAMTKEKIKADRITLYFYDYSKTTSPEVFRGSKANEKAVSKRRTG